MSNYAVHRARLKYYSKIRNIKHVQIVKNVQLCEQIEQVAAWRAESASQTEVLNWAGKISCVCLRFSGAESSGWRSWSSSSSVLLSTMASVGSSLQPVTDADQFVQSAGVHVDLNSMFCVFGVVWIADKSWEKAVVLTAIQCAAGEITTEMSANCLWDSNVHQ